MFTATDVILDEYEKDDTGTFTLGDSETIPVNLVDGSSQFSIDTASEGFTAVITDTKKINIYKGTIYSSLYKSVLTYTNTKESLDSNTWNWDWWKNSGPNGTDLDTNITNLVTTFTNGYMNFSAANNTFMLKVSGKVVLSEYTGTDLQGNKQYKATTTEVGTWTSDANSIDVDLSANYKVLISFTLENSTNKIVENVTQQVGYQDDDFAWSGADAMKFFENYSGLNISASVSNKQIKIEFLDLVHGDETVYATFYANGTYTEFGIENNSNAWHCSGKWKEFATDTFFTTCDDNGSNVVPTGTQSAIDNNQESKIVLDTNAATVTATYYEDAIPGVDTDSGNYTSTDISTINALTNPTSSIVGAYTIKAYTTVEVLSGSGTGIFVQLKINGTSEVMTLNPAHASNGELMLKVFDSSGKIVGTTEHKLIPSDGEDLDFGEIIGN
jgi:hypothetical protein